MASERRTTAVAALSGAGLLACVFCAGMLAQSDFPRPSVLCGLGALALALPFFRALRIVPGTQPVLTDAAPALPVDRQHLLDNALALEARLEHAPIALFHLDGAASDGAVTPMNANARKLVAPGRAVDPSGLYRELAALPVDRRGMIGFDTERGSERALVAVSALSLHGKPQRVAALMPVESELEAEALQAWRQLVHVLTHEIMNSLTPVASLSHTAYELLGEFRDALPQDVGTDLATALDAIRRRADSLVEFVASYRSLSNVPPARPERIRVASLFERVGALVGPAWRARGGDVHFSVEPAPLELIADPGQLEQALINLLKNAFEATAEVGTEAGTEAGTEGGHAWVDARLVRGARLRIEVRDDGPGVPAELAAHIFTPFFTTRKQGGGIGLAMVRHLVHENGGTVRYARSVGRGARFVITF